MAGGGAHMIATYKILGEPDVEPERDHPIEEMLATSDTKFHNIVVRSPCNPDAKPYCVNVPAQMPVHKVLNKLRELYYRSDIVDDE